MKPAPFEYHAPATVAETVELLGELGDDAKVLAGGQSLVPMLALRLARFDHLVDVNRVGALTGVERVDGRVRIGAMTRQARLETDPVVAGDLPALRLATPLVGHFQIRNRGTLGGSLVHADPAAEYPAVALALDAEMEVAGPNGTRRIPAADFFVSMWMTAVGDDELLVAAEFPVWGRRSGFAVEEVARRHGDFALVGAVCGIELDRAAPGADAPIARAAVALFGVGGTPLRATTAEQRLVGQLSGDVDVEAVAAMAVESLDPPDDVHASGRYRRQVAATLVGRCLTRAISRAVER